jgi:subtilisin family serine protease
MSRREKRLLINSGIHPLKTALKTQLSGGSMKKTFAFFVAVVLSIAAFNFPTAQGQGQSGGAAAGAGRTGNFPSDSAPGQREEAALGQYFVAFYGGVTGNDIAAVRAQGANVHALFPEVRAIAIEIRNPNQLAALQRNPRVEYVEPVPMRYKMDLSNSQLTPAVNNGLYGLVTTKATDVHQQLGTTGVGVNVGVADTSLDYNHPDIAANYKGGIDTVGAGDNNPINDDGETHGTHVAGTILGASNSVGVYGVAYSANLYHARVLGPNGGTTTDIMEGVRWLVEQRGCKVVNLSLGGGLKSRTEENFYKDMRNKGALIVAATGNDGKTAISYPAGYAVNIAVGAVDRNNAHADFSNTGRNIDVSAPGVLVLSSVPKGQGAEASVTTTSSSTAFGFEYAGKTEGTTGTLVFCGLGQAGEFPAGVAGNIALIQRGTISFADKVTNAMNAGAAAVVIYNNAAGDFTGTLGAAGAWIPTVSVSDAVGAALKSQASAPSTVVNKTSDWDYYDGTSMATPHVTGVIALIWSKNPSFTNTKVENNLFTTCTNLGAAGYDTTYGYGLVNAYAAVTKP